jgi:hypothetical protein
MNATTLEPKGGTDGSQWARRVVLVTFSLGLLAIVGAVFTRVIAARVPEQRATLEKLIADRTGFAVRFENVHFAWNLDGTSAVFERVELTDPARGRVRVVAPELRVELDTWDFLKHQQFSLGQVKLTSPDIEIIGDPEPTAPRAATQVTSPPRAAAPRSAAQSATRRTPPPSSGIRPEDEAALVRRFTAWAELMPVGRVQVEGARVHLLRRGDAGPRHSFTLDDGVISRGAHSVSAFGTLQLSQDIGQSLFISTKLEGLGTPAGASGELRVIARRVLLEKLDLDVVRGRGTLDARLELRGGRIHQGRWQASARELEFPGGTRYDHFTVNGALRRDRTDVLLEISNLQVSRGARLERAPRLAARLGVAPGSLRIAHFRLDAERIPFLAAELLANAFVPALGEQLRTLPAGWNLVAGELRSVRYDSRADAFEAQLVAAELARGHDRARIAHLATTLGWRQRTLEMRFGGDDVALLWLPGAVEPRPLRLEGMLTVSAAQPLPPLQFTGLKLSSGDGSLDASGSWDAGQPARPPLTLSLAHVDHSLLADVWSVLGLQDALPQLGEVQQGHIVSGQVQLLPTVDAQGLRTVDWRRSRGTLTLSGLATAGADTPRLSDAAGRLEFTRGNTLLRLTAGRVEDVELTAARLSWPRQGQPRWQATLRGDLQSTLLQRAFAGRGLERLTGQVALDAEARGHGAWQDPARWKVTARITEGTLPLGADLPLVTRLAGTVRQAEGELRAAVLEGEWLGGPVRLETRRSGPRAPLAAAVSGSADAAALLQWLGQPRAATQVAGQLSWTGSLLKDGDRWRLAVNGNLAGVESRLPAPFAKSSARAVPLRAELDIGAQRIDAFQITSGADTIGGRHENGVLVTSFDVQGISGELRGAASAASDARLTVDRLPLRRAPQVLGAVATLLPEDQRLSIHVTDLRHSARSLGALQASLTHEEGALDFSLESVSGSRHELGGRGACPTDGPCRMEFTFATRQLPELLALRELPAEWPAQTLRATGELTWPRDAGADIARRVSGQFELESAGTHEGHQLMASARLDSGQIELEDLQGTGPEPDQAFRGQGRIALEARTYDLFIDYERVPLAATAMPSPARAGLTRAWSVLRGAADRRTWAGAEPPRRVQWHGSWEPGLATE